jgi:hypothetical protein
VQQIEWPEDWQTEARDALTPYLGRDVRLRLVVGPPSSIDGTVLEGFVYLDGEVPACIHDHSERLTCTRGR